MATIEKSITFIVACRRVKLVTSIMLGTKWLIGLASIVKVTD